MNYIELYKQSHYHLVESDKKRDQVIAFYTALVGAFLALANGDGEIKGYFLVALAALGVVLSAIVVQYRKWHIRYVNSARLLTNLLVDPQAASADSMRDLRTRTDSDTGIDQQRKLPSCTFLRRYFQGVEFLTYEALLLVAFIPLHMILQQAQLVFLIHTHWIIPFLGNLALYLLIMNACAVWYLYRDFRTQTPFALWVLPRAIEEDLNRPTHNDEHAESGNAAA